MPHDIREHGAPDDDASESDASQTGYSMLDPSSDTDSCEGEDEEDEEFIADSPAKGMRRKRVSVDTRSRTKCPPSCFW